MFTLKTIFKSYAVPKHFRGSYTVPGQDYDIMDLLRRFTRGERLNVSSRPINILADGDTDESFDNILPQLDDITELEEYSDSLKSRKNSIIERRKSKRSDANDEKNDAPKD